MKGLLKFSKTPLAIISSILFVAFMVVLMVVCLVPHGTTYHYSAKMEFGGQSAESVAYFTFKNDKELEIKSETKVNGEVSEDLSMDPIVAFYKIENGKLLIAETEDAEFMEVGTINSFEIKGINPSTNEAMAMKCNTSYVLRDLSIAFMVIGGVLLAGSLTLIILDKKGIIK